MSSRRMKIYAHPKKRNVGDTLTTHLISFFRPDIKIEIVPERIKGKLVAVGSILNNVRAGDSVWGTGAMFESERLARASSVQILAVRGELTRDIILKSGGDCPPVFGDPGLLLPLLYKPHVEKRFEVGVIPHFVDYPAVGRNFGWKKSRCLIDVYQPLREFIDKVVACERIVSSSLHGIVIAEAYGIPAEWVVYSDKVRGEGFKFRDYLTGTGREVTGPGSFPPIQGLQRIQEGLVAALNQIGR